MKTISKKTIINEKDISIENDPDLFPMKVFVNWDLETQQSTTGIAIKVNINSVHFYGCIKNEDQPIAFELDPKNCGIYIEGSWEGGSFREIAPEFIAIDSLTKKAIIHF